ncbi:hypothetical protein O6H91_12G104600 [Diphasiastrum complanatum]|uniref:Uncharacterized protein n=1 Tax=Diphasiastrum complanatum TaxID=34168 RepID=A0ACC2C5I6_DIPCM|nr:hypothetical protein O6H91_12G104600 [Diphasiastrum complanatum]
MKNSVNRSSFAELFTATCNQPQNEDADNRYASSFSEQTHRDQLEVYELNILTNPARSTIVAQINTRIPNRLVAISRSANLTAISTTYHSGAWKLSAFSSPLSSTVSYCLLVMIDVLRLSDYISVLIAYPECGENGVLNIIRIQINKQQCKLLAKKLSGILATLDEIREIVSEELASADAADRREQAAIKELCRVLKAAQALIKDCCCNDHWLKAAIRQGNKKQDFAELLQDVDWCTSVLCGIYFGRTSEETRYVDVRACECDGKLSITDFFTLKAAAKEDQETLKASLKLLKEDHVCLESCKLLPQTEQCLAAQLLGRLQAQALPINRSDVGTSPLILWAYAGELTDGIKLGKGSMGKVYESVWQGEKYAKKKLTNNKSSFFKEEVAALAGLDHPHIVRLVCCCESKNGTLLMELMAEDLHSLLQKRSAPFFNLPAVDLMLQIAEGMKYLHAKTIAHRDLTSLNILIRFADLPASLGEDARVYAKIGDFGLSKIKNASTRYSNQTPNIGTRRWKAPEVIFSVEDDEEDRATSSHPFKTDVYSFGIVCAEILTGKEPFGEDLSLLWRRLEKPYTYTFQSKAVQVQGPWGGTGGGPFFGGIATSIVGFELKFDKDPPCIWSIRVKYDLNGTIFEDSHQGDSNYDNNFIKILFSTNEFLERIEGSFGLQPIYVGPNQVTGALEKRIEALPQEGYASL